MRKIIIILMLFCTITAKADNCDSIRKNLKDHEDICEVGKDVTIGCGIVGTFIGAMTGNKAAPGVCIFPAFVGSFLCSFTDRKKKILEHCEKVEAERLARIHKNELGNSQRETYARAHIDRLIQNYNNKILSYGNTDYWFAQFVLSKQSEGVDLESEDFQIEISLWWARMNKVIDDDKAAALEDFYIGGMKWIDSIKQYGYTQWDDFIRACVTRAYNAELSKDYACVTNECPYISPGSDNHGFNFHYCPH